MIVFVCLILILQTQSITLMKNFKYLSIALLFLWACSSEESYQISGNISDEIDQVFLEKRFDGEFVKVDSAAVINGAFQMSGQIPFTDIYYLSDGGKSRAIVFLENDEYKVLGDSAALSEAKIKGGTVQNEFIAFNDSQDKLYSKLITKYNAIPGLETQAEKEAASAEVDSLYKIHSDNQAKYVSDHPSSPIAVFLLSRIQYGMNAEELGDKLANIDPKLASMDTYDWLKKRVAVLENVAIGNKAPDFEQANADGEMIQFSDIYSKNKYTLVDFWASWCGPCRQENPNVVAAFEKFNSKGFTVFGVSLDQDKERWLKAIDDDELTWKHVSDLSGWQNAAAKEYGVNSIPANFLVDQQGTIIATGLREEALHSKLEALLQ